MARLDSDAIRVSRIKALWIFGGAAVLAVLSSSLLSVGVMNPLVPMPVHQVLLAWATGLGFLVVVPVIYLVTLLWLWGSRRFGVVVLGLSLLLAVLSVIYFANAWNYGVSFQGRAHTTIVAAVNAVGLAVVLALAFSGFRKGDKTMQLAAYFLAFAMLSWCAFPYLGELP